MVNLILRKRAQIAGLTVDERERLSPHGLRAGFITEAYLKGALRAGLYRIHPARDEGDGCCGWLGDHRLWSAMSSSRHSMPRMVKPRVARSSMS
jgi:hypothetical protein